MKDTVHNNDVLFSIAEAAILEQISERAMKKRCKKRKKEFQRFMIRANGGLQYRIPLSMLSTEAQKRYCETLIRDPLLPAIKSLSPLPVFDQQDREADTIFYGGLPAWARKIIDNRLEILAACEGLTGSQLDEFVIAWNVAHPDRQTSPGTIYRYRKLRESDGVRGLAPQYGKRAGISCVPDNLFEHFKTLWLSQGKPPAEMCRLQTLGFAKKLDTNIDITTFPSSSAFLNRMDREIPESAQYYARYGESKWNRKFASYINRDYSNVHAGDIIVSDHHLLDVMVINPETGKPCRPWCTNWRDMKSAKWTSWLLHCAPPSSDHIFYSFYQHCIKYGLPKGILTDNGADYLCSDFAGGRKRYIKVDHLEEYERKCVTTISLLGVERHLAEIRNAQSKPLERDYKVLIDMFCRFCECYCGSNPTVRPENLSKDIKSGKILNFDELSPLFDNFIEDSFNNRKSHGKNIAGATPNKIWADQYLEKREVSKEALALFCMRTSGNVSIGRNGVNDSKFGLLYWGEWMSGSKGKKCYLRRDIKDQANAWVFDALSDEFLGKATAGLLSAHAFAGSEIEKSDLRAALSAKKRDLRIIKAYANVDRSESLINKLENIKVGIQVMNGEIPEANPKVHRIVNSKMDQVIREQKKRELEGTADISAYIPKQRFERPFFQTRTDMDIWLKRHNLTFDEFHEANKEGNLEELLALKRENKNQLAAG